MFSSNFSLYFKDGSFLIMCLCSSSCSSDQRCDEGVWGCVRAAVHSRALQQRPLWDRRRRRKAVAAASQKGKCAVSVIERGSDLLIGHNYTRHKQAVQRKFVSTSCDIIAFESLYFLTHKNVRPHSVKVLENQFVLKSYLLTFLRRLWHSPMFSCLGFVLR